MAAEQKNAFLPFWRPVIYCAGFFIVLFVMLIVRMSGLSYSYTQQAREAVEDERYLQALEHYTWVIRNYFPGNPYVEPAIDESFQTIQQLEQNQQVDNAIYALQDLHASILSIRSLYQPYRTRLNEAEENLDRLKSKER